VLLVFCVSHKKHFNVLY